MSSRARALAFAVLSGTALLGHASAAEPALPRDGWVSWNVPAVADAPAWCCFEWQGADESSGSCNLDARTNGFGTRHHETTDTMIVYARSVAGRLDRLQVLAASCAVRSKTPIHALDAVTADESARWLLAQIEPGARGRGAIMESALGGLAMHRGAFAHDALVRLGQTGASGELRSKAWFWLAMSGDAGAEAPITAAARADRDADVREQAVLALSRLPDERAVRALIALAEDRDLAREQRRRAVFWLGQSESDAALVYLDKVLAAN